MPDIGLTDFVDFALNTGPTQLTKVRAIKHRPDYSPATDFWKPMRDCLVGVAAGDLGLGDIEKAIAKAATGRQPNYRIAAGGFKKFLTRSASGTPCPPPTARWNEGRLGVRVNPEIAYRRGKERLSIKLYFKADPKPTKDRLGAILLLMQEALPRDKVAVLDVRSGKLFQDQSTRANLDLYLRVQANAFTQMWDLL